MLDQGLGQDVQAAQAARGDGQLRVEFVQEPARGLLPIAVRWATGRRWSTNSSISRLGRPGMPWAGRARAERAGATASASIGTGFPRSRAERRAPPSAGCEPAPLRAHSRASLPRPGRSCGGSPRRAGACGINGRKVTQAGGRPASERTIRAASVLIRVWYCLAAVRRHLRLRRSKRPGWRGRRALPGERGVHAGGFHSEQGRITPLRSALQRILRHVRTAYPTV